MHISEKFTSNPWVFQVFRGYHIKFFPPHRPAPPQMALPQDQVQILSDEVSSLGTATSGELEETEWLYRDPSLQNGKHRITEGHNAKRELLGSFRPQRSYLSVPIAQHHRGSDGRGRTTGSRHYPSAWPQRQEFS